MAILLLVVGTARLEAQDTTKTEPQYQELIGELKRGYFNVGVLLQTVLDYQVERTLPLNNGFILENFRLLLSGELDDRFGYFLQTNFARGLSILDAKMYLKITPAAQLDVGLFKTPFSREFLVPASSIDFVNRSRAVALLVAGRQIGIGATVGRSDGPLVFSAGAFNGNGIRPVGNDNDNFMVVGRVSGTASLTRDPDGDATILYGADVAYSQDTDAALIGGRLGSFDGERTLVSADARIQFGPYLVATEWVYGNYRPVGQAMLQPWGGYLTLGYSINPKVQVLARADLLNLDDPIQTSDWLIFGLNVWPTSVTEVQVNYIIDVDQAAPKHHQLLVNFQFGF